MKKITVLIWEGFSLPEDTSNADLIIQSDPSDGFYELLIIYIKNTEIMSALALVFDEQMLDICPQTSFDIYSDISELKNRLKKHFDVSFIESEMSPSFINGGRITKQYCKFGNISLN